jgi:N-acetylglucosamine kinase-like BadF-type ATPase
MGVSDRKIWVVGVDGGGTKSTACLIESTGALLGRLEFAATNYTKNSAQKIAREIPEEVNRILAQLDQHKRKPDVLAACLSGLGREEARTHIKKLLAETGIAQHVVAESDAMAALYGAFAGKAGIAILAGTGSIAFGKAQDGTVFRCGGWGYLLGDEGSGFDIGRNGIAAALKDLDSRGPKTSLRERFEACFKVKSIDMAVTTIYTDYATRGAMAQFAPVVLAEADKGDTIAREIIKKAAIDLSQLAIILAKKLENENLVPVALMGNLFRNALLVERIKAAWQKARANLQPVEPLFPADIGAALLAMESVGIKLPKAQEQKLRAALKSQPG